ncbi:MAG: hypothetical protein AB7S78_08585 [Candidatus Omnitrophota bacterium]
MPEKTEAPPGVLPVFTQFVVVPPQAVGPKDVASDNVAHWACTSFGSDRTT